MSGKTDSKKTQKKTSALTKIFSVVLSLVVVTYMVYLIVQSATKKIDTDYAVAYTYHNNLTCDAFIIRDEQIITRENTGGVLSYNIENGSKVAAGGVVAEVFSGNDGANTRARIAEIDRIITSMGNLGTEGEKISVNVEMLDSKIDSALLKYVEAVESNGLKGIEDIKASLLENLNKKQIAIGSGTGVKTYLDSLKAEKETLLASLSPEDEVRTDYAGLFIKSTDGYEGRLGTADIPELTAEQVKAALKAEPSETSANSVGRVCTSNEWFIATVIPFEKSSAVKEGKEVTVTIPLVSPRELNCTVYKMHTDVTNKETLLVLSCDLFDAALSQARIEKIDIRLDSYDGLKINSSAIRKIDNSVTGVYVLSGVSAVFKPINILYSDESFTVCKYEPDTSGTLRIYDEVITKGSNLYDGKVVR